MKHISQTYDTPYQLKLPLELSAIIETTDPVYAFCEVISHVDLNKYVVNERNSTGRPRYDCTTLLNVILFAFMENGYASTREIAKLCNMCWVFAYFVYRLPQTGCRKSVSRKVQ